MGGVGGVNKKVKKGPDTFFLAEKKGAGYIFSTFAMMK
jgi:hypothetical protein